jgi:hypothetical protein
MQWIKYIFGFFFFATGFSQGLDFDLKVIKATLPQYLNNNPNSLASYIKGNKTYRVLKSSISFSIYFTDSEKVASKQALLALSKYSDSISEVLVKHKITVFLDPILYCYHYNRSNKAGASNYNIRADWENDYQRLAKDFIENDMVILDTIIGTAYLDLIKQQIDLHAENIPLDLKTLDNSYYQFKASKDTLAIKDESSIRAFKLYRPVFNRERNKGCYLFSFYCRSNQICRDFIFIERVRDKWYFLDNYPTHLIEDE